MFGGMIDRLYEEVSTSNVKSVKYVTETSIDAGFSHCKIWFYRFFLLYLVMSRVGIMT